MKDYEKDLCYFLLEDDNFELLRDYWKKLNRLFPDEPSVAYQMFMDFIESKLYVSFRKFISTKGDLYCFVLDLLKTLNYSEMADFIIDFF
jgi:hypothetical protein